MSVDLARLRRAVREQARDTAFVTQVLVDGALRASSRLRDDADRKTKRTEDVDQVEALARRRVGAHESLRL